MKCVITHVDSTKTKVYYIGSPFKLLGYPVPEYSKDKNEAVVFSTKREALALAKRFNNVSVEKWES